MRIPRLHIESPLVQDQSVDVINERAHYLRNVLRLRPGSNVDLFNAEYGEWRAKMVSIERRQITLELNERLKAPSVEEGPTLYFAPFRRNRLEWMLEKAVELGVGRLLPVITERAVVELGRPDRLRARMIEAAEQCLRLSVPEIAEPISLEELLESKPNLIVGDETRRSGSLLQALEEVPDAAMLVGPEGGFSQVELDMLNDAEARMVSLGPLILRTETAALYMLGAWRALEMDVEEAE